MSQTLIIDYGAGNLRSVLNSARAVAFAGENIELCGDVALIAKADRIILPGVGAYHDCRAGLTKVDGMVEALNEFVISERPFLGVCVGMQLLVNSGDEHGIHTEGLGWLSGHVSDITPSNPDAKIPHMGWNALNIKQAHPLLNDIEDGSDVYFVHSYAVQNAPQNECIASTDYFGDVTAVIGKDNIVGTQFHPEKSQKVGLQMIRNFLDWRP